MSNLRAFHSGIAFLAICFSAALPAGPVSAQSSDKEKPKIKDFGKSLKGFREKLENDSPRAGAAAGQSPAGEKAAQGGDEEVLRVKTTLVVCDVLVTDPQGQPVQGLTGDDFVVTEDDSPQQVETFALGDAAEIPRTIVLIIDYSGSQYPFIKTSIAAAKTLIDKLNPGDRMAIVTDDVELLADFTKDRLKLKKKLDSLEKRTEANGFLVRSRRFGKSQQYSALLATLNEAFDEEDQRPIIIFQTDGDELPFLRDTVYDPAIPDHLNAAEREAALKAIARTREMIRENMRDFGLADISRTAEKTRATVYTVVPGYRFAGLPPEEHVGQMKAYLWRRIETWSGKTQAKKFLEERLSKTPDDALKIQAQEFVKLQTALAGVTEITGGWTDFLETPEQAAEIYSRILADINRRYLVGYYPTNSEPDGKRRRVNVQVRNHPEYVVWGRKSYLAAGN